MSKTNNSKTSDKSTTVEKLKYKTMFRLYKVFGRHYKTHWKLLTLAYTGLLLTILIALLLPWPLKLILDHVILQLPLPPEAAFLNQWFGTAAETLLLGLAISFIVLQVLDSIVSYMHKVGMLSAAELMIADIRKQIFAHLQRLSLSFHQSSRAGDLIYRLTSDITNIKTILVTLPEAIVYRFIMIVSHVALMLYLEWRLALIAFSVIPILYYYQRRFGAGVQSATKKKRKKESDVTSLVAENVTAMALVHAYGREDSQQARFTSENRKSLESGIAAMRLSKMFKRVSDLLVGLGTAGVVYYGGVLAIDGVILPGTLILFASYLKNLYKPVEKFAAILLNVVKAQVSGDRLLELVESKMVMQDRPDAIPAPPFRGEIEFRDVSFAYKKGADVLKNVSFKVDAGEQVALVGHSGAGKSTLISLLLRFYDPRTGQLLVDGHDIRKFTLKSLRDQITVLMQDARLFNTSVKENIGFGKTTALDGEIERAAKLAQAHEFISEMSNGYKSVISEGGDNLSGGQKQRINIARAIIRDTPIVILDEPSTSLDAESEAKLNTALRELTRGRTTFTIAHKFSTIANADKILVLEKGALQGFGRHQELLERCPEYRELHELQFNRRGTSDVYEIETTDGDGKLVSMD